MSFDYSAQPKEEVTQCNLCGGSGFDVLALRDRYDFLAPTVKCRLCNLVFLNPRMTAEAYKDFYANGTYREILSEFYGRPFTAETIEVEQEAYAKALLELLLPRVPDSAKTLLDVGGSTGVVSSAFLRAHRGLFVTVMEPAEAEADRAEARGLRVLRETIEEHEPNGERFDVVLLCQAADHLLDLSGALRTIRAMLEDGGLFFVDIVDGGPYKVDHPYSLTRATMGDYLRRTGFKYESHFAEDGVHVNFICGRA